MPVIVEQSALSNGLRVVTTPIPTTQAVSVSLFVGVGSRSEPKHLNGITHFLEHMVFKGTERRPDAILIAQAIEGAGGVLNAYTNKEFTCYWNIVPYNHFATAFDVGVDMLRNSKLVQGEIDRERTVVQQELKRDHDNPGSWAARLIGQAVYGDQPTGWDVGGSVELVEEMQRPDFVEHIGQWYHPSNIVVSVAGNVSHQQVMELVNPLFGDMPSQDLPSVLPLVRSGQLRALAVTSLSRSALMPELATVAETGLPGFEVIVWYGVLAPAATPRPIITRLNGYLTQMATLPEVKERLSGQGAEAISSTPEAFARKIREDIAIWAKVVQVSGARADGP